MHRVAPPTFESTDPHDQSRKASSHNRRLSASSIPLASNTMLPRLCIVGLIAILGEERWLDEVDKSALDPVCLILPIIERRKLVSEFVPNLDRVVPTGEWLRLLEFVVRRRTGGAGNEEL